MLSRLSRSFIVPKVAMGRRTYAMTSSCRMCAEAGDDGAPELPLTELSRLEIRVGKIVEISKHPEAEQCYVEKVDCGEEEGPRTIVSGLVQFCSEESLLNRDVVVLCNLKPRAIKGITSAGMLLCASNKADSEVEPLSPPAGAVIGELITFDGHKAAPMDAGNRASKAYSKVSDKLFVDEAGRATYDGIPFMTPAGPCTGKIVKGIIS